VAFAAFFPSAAPICSRQKAAFPAFKGFGSLTASTSNGTPRLPQLIIESMFGERAKVMKYPEGPVSELRRLIRCGRSSQVGTGLVEQPAPSNRHATAMTKKIGWLENGNGSVPHNRIFAFIVKGSGLDT